MNFDGMLGKSLLRGETGAETLVDKGGQSVPSRGNSLCKCPETEIHCQIQETNCSE